MGLIDSIITISRVLKLRLSADRLPGGHSEPVKAALEDLRNDEDVAELLDPEVFHEHANLTVHVQDLEEDNERQRKDESEFQYAVERARLILDKIKSDPLYYGKSYTLVMTIVDEVLNALDNYQQTVKALRHSGLPVQSIAHVGRTGCQFTHEQPDKQYGVYEAAGGYEVTIFYSEEVTPEQHDIARKRLSEWGLV